MNKEHIKQVQERIGTYPDGRWGSKSQTALQKHLQKLLPNPYPFPKSYKEMFTFYGEPGTPEVPCKGLTRINTSNLRLLYGMSKVSSVQCHEKIAPSLLGFLTELNGSEFGYVLGEYGGCYNPRKVRGGSNFSDHAWGAAIDLCPTKNKLRWHWPMQAHMPLEVYEIAARWGATSLGWTGNYDAMHIRWAI